MSMLFVDKLLDFWSRQNQATRMALTVATASTLTATSILTIQAVQKRARRQSLLDREQRPASSSSSSSSTAFDFLHSTNDDFNESLIQEQLSQYVEFLGHDRVEKLRKSFVIVVGAGGVGSWAALMLARAGVQQIRIIDFDQVTLSSLNRHAVATLDDVGTPKVTAIKKHLERIAPFVHVDSRIELFTHETADRLLEGDPDYVVDAIDNIDTKLYLIKYCHDRKLPVISSMGAGAKADPSRIQMADISGTLEDPLARAVRRKLKKMGVEDGVPVVYSAEKPHHVKLLPLDAEKVAEADDFAALPEFRARILPVLGTIPSMFGMTIATYVILRLAEYPGFEPLVIKLREGLYTRLHRDLMAREKNHYGNKICPLDIRDVAYIFEEMWQARSILSGPSDKLALTRWDRSKPLSYFNTVCMTRHEANAHDKLPPGTDLRSHYGDSVCDMVQDKFRTEQRIRDRWDNVF